MIERLMFWAILGHFVGDYLLQSKRTAIGKSAPGWLGVLTCLAHCFWYTTAVCLSVQVGTGMTSFGVGWSGWIVPMVFLSHYPIDRWSLADKWLRFIGGRQFDDFLVGPTGRAQETDLRLNLVHGSYMATQQAFYAIVYAVVDNTLHILLMLAGFAVLLRWKVIGG